MSKLFILAAAFLVAVTVVTCNREIVYEEDAFDPEKLTGQDLVNYVNSRQGLWKAEINAKFASFSKKVVSGLLGVNHVRLSTKALKHMSPTHAAVVDIPDEFDSREYWPKCPGIKEIRDQSSCGSCYLESSTSVISDRLCIASEGQIQDEISVADPLACCKACGYGCDGGEPLEVFKFYVKEGIVTGSEYGDTKNTCRPYPFPQCEHHSNSTHFSPCKHDLFPTPKCEHKCQNKYTKSYKDDKHYGKIAYSIKRDEASIQKEVLLHGPVSVAFEVYEDFMLYKGGIYEHKGGKMEGGHAVRLIGWGVERGVKYWLIANSWNEDWGEKGTFRIRRGTNECGIEESAVAGLPKLTKIRGRFYSQGKVHQESSSEELFF
uniref:Pept_C1 domain-containing protein n=1 Tax=Rhabditophanes sp. KR3021 TaxID=114890 RepID=A0AC35UGT0_9BILA